MPQRFQRAFAAACDIDEMKKAFNIMAPFFVSDVPSLRKKSADELYANLKTRVTSGNPLSFDFNKLEEILTKTEWKLDFNSSAESLKKLCEIYGVPVPYYTVPAQQQQVEKNKYDYDAMIKSLH